MILAAVVFVFICGANDGGSLLTLAIRHRGASASLALGLLAGAVVTGPAVFGLSVATTFTDGLIAAPGRTAELTFLAGTGVTIAVVLILTWSGIPTSITLALLGAIAGAALGLGAAPAWNRLGLVLVLGAAAPVAGLVVAYLLGRVTARARLARAGRWTGLLQLLAFGAQCLAYAANDGQKMFAVVTMTAAGAGHPVVLTGHVVPVLVIGAVFAAGAVASLRRVGRGAGLKLVRIRPGHVIAAEVASSAAVFGSAGLGVPVSMTQAAAGGLIGAGLNDGPRSVRWQFAVPLVVAWAVTLPTALVGGLIAGLLLRGV
nr:inorganic phosphate transporter [Kribbella shirazensis]